MFNVTEYLDDVGVPYTEGPKRNVAAGWIGVDCPYCGDARNHFGINLERGNFKCWVCGKVGGSITLVAKLSRVTWGEASLLVEKFTTNFKPPVVKIEKPTGRLLPVGYKSLATYDRIPPLVRRFLKSRGYTLEVARKYRTGWCRLGGEYPQHLIVPVREKGKTVSFVAIDMTGKAEIKYNMCPNSRAKVPKEELLYNLDIASKQDQIIIVEGVFDAWRVGDRAVALLTSEITTKQAIKLSHNLPMNRPIKVCLDHDAVKKGKKVANILGNYFFDVKHVVLDKGDPDNLTDKEIRHLISL